MNSLACRAGSSLLILGGGAVGLSAVLGAVLQGCQEIIVAEPLRVRRELALSLGATRVIDPVADPLPGAARRPAQWHPLRLRYHRYREGDEDGVACLGLRGTFGYVGVPADPGAKLPGSIISAMQQGHTHRGIIEGDSNPDTFIPQSDRTTSRRPFPVRCADRDLPARRDQSRRRRATPGRLRQSAVLVTGQN